jgi:transposase InsO family protein
MARLMRYDFELEYCPGKELIVPDFLSRAVSNDEHRCRCHFLGTDIEIEQAFVSMVRAVQVSEEIEKKVRECSGNESEYQAMRKAYGAAWPRNMRENCGEYWSHRDEIIEEDGLLFFQGRLVIPKLARKRLLESLHRGHVGQKAAMMRATKAVWWPGWTSQIKDYGKSCGQCQEMKPAQQKETMKSFPVPPAPGLVWHSDFLSWRGQEYVFFVDGFSGWAELYTAPSRTPAALTRITRLQMMRQGVPRQINADQGSTYQSQEFKAFCEKWGIKLVLSSPKHEQGNAIAEAYVKKIKKLFMGAACEDELVTAFLAMNQTPIASGRPSPAEIHLGRNVRDELHGKISPSQVDWEEMKLWKEELQMNNKTLYDRNARDLAELKSGDQVRVWHNEKWNKGVVKEKSKERPRSYKVELEEGRCLERNRVKIRKAESDERPANERKVSPMLTFSQALPSLEAAPRPRWGVLISTENDPGTSPDQEMNSEESTVREDSGPSTSLDSRPPAPPARPVAKKKATSKASTTQNKPSVEINVPEYIPVANTRSGRPVKDPDRLIVSM